MKKIIYCFSIIILVSFFMIINVYGELSGEYTVVAESGDYKPYFPSITKCENGDLIVVYRLAKAHTNDGKIYKKISKDNGKTWIEENEIAFKNEDSVFPVGHDLRDPNITKLSDGKLYLTFFYNTYNEDGDIVRGNVYMSVSEDNGESWSDVVEVVEKAGNKGTIIEIGNGELLCPVYKNGSKVCVMKSDDGGVTWDDWSEITQGGDECSIIYAKGIVYALVRPKGWLYKSYDKGKTWSCEIQLAGEINAPNFLKIDDNRIFTSWCRKDKVTGTRPVEGKMFFTESNWLNTSKQLIYDSDVDNNWDMGYPGTVKIDDNTIFTVYYDSKLKSLKGKYSTISGWGVPSDLVEIVNETNGSFKAIYKRTDGRKSGEEYYNSNKERNKYYYYNSEEKLTQIDYYLSDGERYIGRDYYYSFDKNNEYLGYLYAHKYYYNMDDTEVYSFFKSKGSDYLREKYHLKQIDYFRSDKTTKGRVYYYNYKNDEIEKQYLGYKYAYKYIEEDGKTIRQIDYYREDGTIKGREYNYNFSTGGENLGYKYAYKYIKVDGKSIDQIVYYNEDGVVIKVEIYQLNGTIITIYP